MRRVVTPPTSSSERIATGRAGAESVGTLLDERTAHGPAIVRTTGACRVVEENVDHHCDRADRQKLLIARRDRTSLIDGLDRQVDVVRAALAMTTVTSRCAACCASPRRAVAVRTLTIRSPLPPYRKAIAQHIKREGPHSPNVSAQIARKLAATLLPPEPTAADQQDVITGRRTCTHGAPSTPYTPWEAERGEAQPTT